MMRTIGLVGILTIAALRAMVSVEPNVWFADVDPARDAMPLLVLGAAKSHILDLALFASAAMALIGEWRAKRGIRLGLVLLALLPVPVAILHARTGVVAENGFRGDTWIAAIFAFVALAHLVRDRAMRAIALSVLLALTSLLAVRGAVQVLVEHPATVAHFDKTRDEFFAARGWLADSSIAQSYERRLRQPEATGWFGLSNPYSTMMGVGVVGFAALAFLARRMQQSGNTLLLALAACACGALLLVNGGKGAIGATVIAAGALVVFLRVARTRDTLPSARWALVLAGLMLALVGARWLVGTRIGELSLLFRGYYIEAGLRIASDPDWFLLGCGPDRVQEFFNAAKPENCPEDVKSLHSIFFDWFVAFGVSGVAWIALVFAAFWPARVTHNDSVLADAEALRVRRTAVFVAIGCGVFGTALASIVESPIVDAYWVVTRLLGVFAFALLAMCAAHAAAVISGLTLRAVAFAIGVLVLVHAQIETVAWMPGSCVLALAFLACATDLPVGASTKLAADRAPARSFALSASTGCLNSLSNGLSIAVLGVLALLSMSIGLAQDLSRGSRVANVAAQLGVLAADSSARDSAREYDLRMDAARQLSAGDYAWSRFELEAAVAQALAAAQVARAEAKDPADHVGVRELAALELAQKVAWRRQLRGSKSDALRADVALASIRRAFADGASSEGASASEGASSSEGELRDPDERWNVFTLLNVVARGAERFPKNPRRWIALGEAREIVRAALEADGMNSLASEIDDPREAYERAYVVNAKLALDPLAQLSPRELALLQQKLGTNADPYSDARFDPSSEPSAAANPAGSHSARSPSDARDAQR